nr:transcriptional regulatory protein AlgP-like [Pongo pygmaeus]XP_054340034.1 transcriptional regulatory protein AlgP-like [Pongo pygmaeus]
MSDKIAGKDADTTENIRAPQLAPGAVVRRLPLHCPGGLSPPHPAVAAPFPRVGAAAAGKWRQPNRVALKPPFTNANPCLPWINGGGARPSVPEGLWGAPGESRKRSGVAVARRRLSLLAWPAEEGAGSGRAEPAAPRAVPRLRRGVRPASPRQHPAGCPQHSTVRQAAASSPRLPHIPSPQPRRQPRRPLWICLDWSWKVQTKSVALAGCRGRGGGCPTSPGQVSGVASAFGEAAAARPCARARRRPLRSALRPGTAAAAPLGPAPGHGGGRSARPCARARRRPLRSPREGARGQGWTLAPPPPPTLSSASTPGTPASSNYGFEAAAAAAAVTEAWPVAAAARCPLCDWEKEEKWGCLVGERNSGAACKDLRGKMLRAPRSLVNRVWRGMISFCDIYVLNNRHA